jgi:hypothetical protein
MTTDPNNNNNSTDNNNNSTPAANNNNHTAIAKRAQQLGTLVASIGNVPTEEETARALRATYILVWGSRGPVAGGGLSPAHFPHFLEALPLRMTVMEWTAADARALSAALTLALAADVSASAAAAAAEEASAAAEAQQ